MTDTPTHGCTIDGQPAIPILAADYNRLIADLAEARAEIQRHADAEAAEQSRTTPNNPPGSTREQLPPAVLALLPTHPYTSTACQTADAVAITAVRGLPMYAELRAHAERLHARCRLNHKFTGVACRCGCHEAEEPAAPDAGSDLVAVVDKAAPDELCAGRPCAGSGCAHEQAADELIAHDQGSGHYPTEPAARIRQLKDLLHEILDEQYLPIRAADGTGEIEYYQPCRVLPSVYGRWIAVRDGKVQP
ncbi:hypothetical protein ABZ725_14240 [Streptomyces sp. NPDC006872]|uniref:hypothetical protein n=1 Tax=Streptomyces sp. NPDC006872 TaxID=3155720 RepID=UPI0033CBD725